MSFFYRQTWLSVFLQYSFLPFFTMWNFGHAAPTTFSIMLFFWSFIDYRHAFITTSVVLPDRNLMHDSCSILISTIFWEI